MRTPSSMLVVVLLAACGSSPPPAPEKKKTEAADPRPAGMLIDALEKRQTGPAPGDAVVTFAVFSGQAPPRDLQQRTVVLRGLVEATYTTPPPDLAPVVARAAPPTDLLITMQKAGPDLPLNLEALTADEATAASIRSAQTVAIVRYQGKPAFDVAHLSAAAVAAAVIAHELSGVVADLGTLRVWPEKSWRQALVPEDWIDDQLSLEAAQGDDGAVLFFTRGMAKLGLPDLEQTGVPAATARDAFQAFQQKWAALRAKGYVKVGDAVDGVVLQACKRPAAHYDHECVALPAP